MVKLDTQTKIDRNLNKKWTKHDICPEGQRINGLYENKNLREITGLSHSFLEIGYFVEFEN